jgi:hypothetical protein
MPSQAEYFSQNSLNIDELRFLDVVPQCSEKYDFNV